MRLFVHRPRPFVADPNIHALISETSYSFPSGHAAFFFALSTTVYLYNKRWGVWFFVASAVIGLARVMAGVHYLTDIAGGAVLGVAVGWGVHKLFSKKHHPSSPLLN
ncbi:MAG: phosphatase PAP2 family protein [Candidatus Taylorbacteria bacterium]|nr:phosphatase PAP2 family protein [Candidatus Taylorbacteria bacterium]